MNRYNKKYIFYTFLASLPSVLIVGILAMMIFTTEDENTEELIFRGTFGVDNFTTLGIIIGVTSVLYIIGLFVLSILWWHKTTYNIDDTAITLKSGIFYRKNIALPFNKVQAITIDRPLFMRFFGLAKLAIDSGNTTKLNNEIVIIDDLANISKLEKILQSKLKSEVSELVDNDEVDILHYKMDWKLASTFVFNNVWLYLILIISIAIAGLITGVTEDALAAISFAILPIGSFLLFYIIAVTTLMTTYYDYKVIKKEDAVIVSFGLFSKKRIVVNKEKIKSVVINQDLVQLKTGFASIKLEIIGLKSAENQDEIRIDNILPFIKIKDVQSVLDIFGTDFVIKPVNHKCKKGSLVFFMLLPMLFASLIGLPFIIGQLAGGLTDIPLFIIFMTIYLTALLLILLISLCQNCNQGIGNDDKNLYLTNGGLVKKYYIIPWKNVVSMGSFTTPLRKNKGVCSAVVTIYASKLDAQKTVSMLDCQVVEDLTTTFENIK